MHMCGESQRVQRLPGLCAILLRVSPRCCCFAVRTFIAESESDRAGEIDLIAIDERKKIIIFVEVKTHSTTKPGHPADRVDEAKQGRVSRAAMRYLKRKKLLGSPVRFDVIAVWWHSDGPQPDKIEHYEAAFECAGDFQMF